MSDVAAVRKAFLDNFVVAPERHLTAADMEMESPAWTKQDMIDHLMGTREREFASGLVTVTLHNLIPAFQAIVASGTRPEGFEVTYEGDVPTVGIGGPDGFLVTMALGREDTNSIKATIRSRARLDWDKPARIADGQIYTIMERNGGDGWLDPTATSEFFRFTELARQALGFPHERRADLFLMMPFGLHGTKGIHQLTEVDGGLPGDNWREILLAQHEAHLALKLRPWVGKIEDLFDGLSELGYVWGDKYLAYNDTDMRTCAIPLENGVAVFHENIDLCDAVTGYIAAVRKDLAGKVTAMEIHPLRRDTDSPSALLEDIRAGSPGTVPGIELDLATGSTGRTNVVDLPGFLAYVPSGLKNDAYIVRELRNGKEFEWGVEDRTNFEDLEPWDENEVEEEPEGGWNP